MISWAFWWTHQSVFDCRVNGNGSRWHRGFVSAPPSVSSLAKDNGVCFRWKSRFRFIEKVVGELLLRRTRVVLFVHLVSFDFLSFHLDLSRNSASFPKRQTGLIVGFVWLFRTPLLAEFQLFPISRKPAIPSLPQGKEMQSRKERLALLCPAAFFCTWNESFSKRKAEWPIPGASERP